MTASRRVSQALRAADAGSAYHWPTIAAILAAEVRRLRALLDEARPLTGRILVALGLFLGCLATVPMVATAVLLTDRWPA